MMYLFVILFHFLLIQLSWQQPVRLAANTYLTPAEKWSAYEKAITTKNLTIQDLVGLRPIKKSTRKWIRYIKEFANHPAVKNIKLMNVEKSEIARQFLNLPNGNEDRGWNYKYTASVKDFLENKGFSEKAAEEIKLLFFHKRRRMESLKIVSHLRIANPEKYRSQRALSMRLQRAEMTQRRIQPPEKVLNQPLKNHFGPLETRLTPLQVIEKAKDFRSQYGSHRKLTWAIKKYFRDHHYLEEEANVALAIRSSELVKGRNNNLKRAEMRLDLPPHVSSPRERNLESSLAQPIRSPVGTPLQPISRSKTTDTSTPYSASASRSHDRRIMGTITPSTLDKDTVPNFASKNTLVRKETIPSYPAKTAFSVPSIDLHLQNIDWWHPRYW